MNNATTIFIIVTLCLLLLTFLIYKINGKHISKPFPEKEQQKTKVKNVMVKPSQLPTVNARGLPSLAISDGLPPDLFGRMYKPNQRKLRKRKRQNPCI